MDALFSTLALVAVEAAIVISGSATRDYEYRVTSVRTVEKATADLQEILGPTSEPSRTLINDSGMLDPVTGAFLRSTIVRAVRRLYVTMDLLDTVAKHQGLVALLSASVPPPRAQARP
jgi:hypothetical protein